MLVYHAAADHDLDLVPKSRFLNGFYRLFHGFKGNSQESTQPDDVWLLLLNRLDKTLHRNVDAQIVDVYAIHI